MPHLQQPLQELFRDPYAFLGRLTVAAFIAQATFACLEQITTYLVHFVRHACRECGIRLNKRARRCTPRTPARTKRRA